MKDNRIQNNFNGTTNFNGPVQFSGRDIMNEVSTAEQVKAKYTAEPK